MQSVNVFLATTILVAFIVTIVLGAGSYLAYKLREWKRASDIRAPADDAPVFFERYFPRAVTEPDGGSGDGTT